MQLIYNWKLITIINYDSWFIFYIIYNFNFGFIPNPIFRLIFIAATVFPLQNHSFNSASLDIIGSQALSCKTLFPICFRVISISNIRFFCDFVQFLYPDHFALIFFSKWVQVPDICIREREILLQSSLKLNWITPKPIRIPFQHVWKQTWYEFIQAFSALWGIYYFSN